MASPRNDRQHTLPMFLASPAKLLHHSRIAILVATYGETVTLDEALLEWTDGSCVYRTPKHAALVNNETLELVRDPACHASAAEPANLQFTVRLTEREKSVAVWAYQPQPGATLAPDLIRQWQGDPGSNIAGVVRGAYLEADGPQSRRLTLFNYVWNVAADPTWIWATLAVAGGLTAIGVLLLFPARAIASASCIALSLGLLYATFIPPLEAPDEPDHLLAFANITGRPGMESSAKTLARRGHLKRLQFHGEERFRNRDIGHPYPTPWGDEVYAHDVEARSLTTFWWWKVAGRLTSGLTTPRTLLACRLGNALLFAATIGLTTLLFRAAGPPTAERTWMPLVLLLVPTLPFFGTHLAEFALLTDAYVLLAASLAVLLADGPAAHRIGFPLGAAIALALLSGRSAAPILPLVAAALAGRALLGSRDGPPRATEWFWLACGAGLAVFPASVNDQFSRGLWPSVTGPMPGWFRYTAELLRTHPSILLAAVPIGYACELLTRRLPVLREARVARGSARAVGYALAAAVAVSLIASLFLTFPTLPTREASPPADMGTYVARVMATGLTSLRLRAPDLLLSASFWGGFGWIDAVLPSGFVIALTTATAAALILTGLSIARRQDARHALWMVILASGGAASLVAYAVSNHFLNRNLHGRYLLGLYVAGVLASWTIPVVCGRTKFPGRAWCVGAVIAIHAYALPYVLLRYF